MNLFYSPVSIGQFGIESDSELKITQCDAFSVINEGEQTAILFDSLTLLPGEERPFTQLIGGKYDIKVPVRFTGTGIKKISVLKFVILPEEKPLKG